MQTFASFVVSDSSRAALAAALAITERSDRAPNPLVICGPIGSGKSHLLRAIAHGVRSLRPHAHILSQSTRMLVEAIVNAIRSDELPALRQSLLAIDVILLDDFQFGPGMVNTREEVFRRLEQSVFCGAQVVVAAQHMPLESSIQQRAFPFLEHADVVELGYPDIDARVELARRAAEFFSLALPDDALRYLAEKLTGTPRVIQSVIARISAEAPLSRERLDIEYIRRIVERL